jgi:hypothetical protein
VLLSLALFATRSVTVDIALAGLLIVWLSALPGLVHLQSADPPPIPFLPYVGIYYLVFFGLPVFAGPLSFRCENNVVLYYRVLVETLSIDALLVVAGGVALMFASFGLVQKTLGARLPPFKNGTTMNPPHLTLLYWPLLLASLAYRYSPALQALPSIGQFLDPVGLLALGGFFLLWLANDLPKAQALLLLFVVLPLELYVRLRFLFVSDLMFFFVFFAFILWRSGRKKTLLALAVLGVFCVLTYNVTTVARSMGATFSEKMALSVREVGSIFRSSEIVVPATDDRLSVAYDRRVAPLVHRIGQIWIFQAVYDRSPDPIPYLEGETYRPLMTSFIPRILYPDKPEERAGGMFGYRYGFLGQDSGDTSVNIPWIVELLVNFGPVGVLAGMTIFGALLGLLDRAFNRHGMTDLEFLVGLILIYRLGYQESNFSVMTGSLLPLFVVLFSYFHFGSMVLGRLAPKP